MQLLVSMVIKIYWVNSLHLFSPTPVRQKLQISDVDSPDFKLQPGLKGKLSGRAGLLLSLVLYPLLRALMEEMLMGSPSSHLLKTLFTNELIYPHSPAGREGGSQSARYLDKGTRVGV